MSALELPERCITVRSRVTGLPPEEHRIVVLPSGFTMHVLVINPAAECAVLFLHGVGSSPSLLRHPLYYFAFVHNVKIYVLYLPCHGVSDDVRSFPELLEVIGESAEQLGIHDDAWMGHSLGAHLMMCLASLRPELIATGVGLAMPTKIHTSGLRFLASMPILAGDALVTSPVALMESLFDGNVVELSSALVEAGFRVLQGRKIFEVLKGSYDLTDVIPHIQQHFRLLFGGADLVVRPPRAPVGDNIQIDVLPGMPHNFLWLWPAMPAVSAALDEALALAHPGRLAEVIPISSHPQWLPAS